MSRYRKGDKVIFYRPESDLGGWSRRCRPPLIKNKIYVVKYVSDDGCIIVEGDGFELWISDKCFKLCDLDKKKEYPIVQWLRNNIK